MGLRPRQMAERSLRRELVETDLGREVADRALRAGAIEAEKRAGHGEQDAGVATDHGNSDRRGRTDGRAREAEGERAPVPTLQSAEAARQFTIRAAIYEQEFLGAVAIDIRGAYDTAGQAFFGERPGIAPHRTSGAEGEDSGRSIGGDEHEGLRPTPVDVGNGEGSPTGGWQFVQKTVEAFEHRRQSSRPARSS